MGTLKTGLALALGVLAAATPTLASAACRGIGGEQLRQCMIAEAKTRAQQNRELAQAQKPALDAQIAANRAAAAAEREAFLKRMGR